MKLNKYIGLAALPIMFTACQNDMLDGGTQHNQPIYSLSGKMDKGVDSRAQIQLGNPDESGEIFMWNEGDSFALYQGTEGVTFNISPDYKETGGGDKTQATFSTDVPVYAGNYIAVYPADIPVENEHLQFEFQRYLDFSNAKSDEERNDVWTKYFQNNMFMMAKGELTTDGVNALQFQHLASLARITYHNASNSEQTIDWFMLSGQEQLYGTQKEYSMEGFHVAGSATTGFSMDLNGGLTVAAGESTDLYLLFFPEQFNENGTVELFFSLNTGSRSVSIPVADIAAANNGATGFQEGMRYWFDVTATNGGLLFSKNYSVAPITFENVELSAALQSMYGPDVVKIDKTTGFGTMIEADVTSITRLDFGWGDYQIPSLRGIEKFKNLETLECHSSGVMECDLSENTKLRYIGLSYNDLREMNLNNQKDLIQVNLQGNLNLSSLLIDNCMQLEYLHVEETNLTTLNIPNKSKIYNMGYGSTRLSFDLNEFSSLEILNISDLKLTSLDFIPSKIKSQLWILECHNNQINNIDLSEFPKLENLTIYNNNIKSLDLTHVPLLSFLNCHSCYISRLDISPLENLQTLFCGCQNNGIMLTLVANEAQQERWRNEWSKYAYASGLNDNAYLEGEEPTVIPGGNGSLDNFGSGGEF